MKVFQGWAHFCISEEAARFCIEFSDANPEYREFFKNVYAADESYFHTILYNSPFIERTVLKGPLGEDRRIDLKACLNLTYFEYPQKVRIFTTKQEYDDILKSSGCLYFRKVVSGKSDELLDYIDSL